jgi:hypothetical protein
MQPTMPYALEKHPSPTGDRWWAHYPDGGARPLTPDEERVGVYVTALEGRADELESELATLRATLEAKPKKGTK